MLRTCDERGNGLVDAAGARIPRIGGRAVGADLQLEESPRRRHIPAVRSRVFRQQRDGPA